MTQEVKQYDMDYYAAPGGILESSMEALGISAAELARRCGRSEKLISEIISGKAPIEPRTAVQLERVMGLTARTWLRIEADYRFQEIRKVALEEDAKSCDWAEAFPLKELVRRGYFSNPLSDGDRVFKLLAFFGVATVDIWHDHYESASIAYRNSHFPSNRSNFDLITWLRMGELEAEAQYTVAYSKDRFRAAVREVRQATRLPIERAIEQATETCNRAGVSLVVVRPIQDLAPAGAAWWMTKQRPVIALDAHHGNDDEFWFTFFHEAAHLVLHGKKRVHLDAGGGSNEEAMEVQADNWAMNMIIPRGDWAGFVAEAKFGAMSVEKFARKQGIATGLVAARLQREGRVSGNRLNGLKKRLPRRVMNNLDIEYRWIPGTR